MFLVYEEAQLKGEVVPGKCRKMVLKELQKLVCPHHFYGTGHRI